MKRVELYQKVRRAVLVDKMSRRSAARYFGIDRKTVDKMLVFPAPPPHGRKGRTFSRKLEGLTDFINQILADEILADEILADERTVHAKQRHTVVRIYERLRDERGFTGGETIVREYVASASMWRCRCDLHARWFGFGAFPQKARRLRCR